MKKISSRTVKAINCLSPETLEKHGVLISARNGGYICPMKDCDNGDGNDGTGVKPHVTETHVGYKCFKCGESFNNLRIFAEHYNIDRRSNFNALVEKICADFNLPLEYDDFDAPTYKRNRGKKKKDDPIDDAELELIRQDLNVDTEPLKNMVKYSPKSLWRGLPIEQWLKFGCRYVANWTPPSSRKIREGAYNITMQTPRLLIPSGDSGYLARLTLPLKHFDIKIRNTIIEKQHAGRKSLFNADALTTAAQIFCVEGYIDAISIDFAGFAAVALGGADRADLLVDVVAKMEQKPQIIVMLDSDDAGRKAAAKLYGELIGVGCSCCVRFLADDKSKIDANQILVESGVDDLRGRLQSIFEDSLAELAAVERDLAEKKETRIQDDVLNFLFDGDASDLDFARRLEKFCGERVRWLTDSERWLIYGGGVWTRSSEKNSAVAPFGHKLADVMKKFAENADERELADKFKSAKKIGSAITLLKSCDSIRITQDDLDRHAELLNCLNGVVDLQTGKLMNAAPELLLTQQCRAAYDPNAQSELVDKFFRDIMPDEETRAGLLRWLGFNLTGEIAEEKFMIWTGDGGNGKGVLGGTLLELTGDYGTGLTPRALLKNRNDRDADKATTALNSIELARFALSEELPADAELDCSLVKNLTGGDRINLRKNYGEYRTIKPTAKINISGNYTPRLENVFDGGILRRLLNMPFTVRFGTANNPADPHLKKKLLLPENLSAMFGLLVRESVAWYRGDGLIISPLMKEATEEHLSQNDFVADFIADNYVFVPTASVKAKDFIEHLRREYPRECARFKRADLIELIAKVDGVTYGDDNNHCRAFRGIGKLANVDDFDSEPVKTNTAPPDDEPEKEWHCPATGFSF